MTRAEFIKTYADLCAEGRNVHHPNMRPSEKAMARVSDQESAAKHWRKSRQWWIDKTPADLRLLIAAANPEVPLA